ncbi:hypothetical protein ACFS07_04885 [Undibacterium arcticum]
MRTSAVPGQPTPRDESIRRSLTDAPFASTIEQMAAHEYGNVIVVSFFVEARRSAIESAAAADLCGRHLEAG